MSNALNWFEIPVTDLARAKEFYGRVLQAELREHAMNGTTMAILPYQNGGVGGALITGEPYVPSTQGTIVYLNAGDDLDGALRRVEDAGGKVVMGATHLSDEIGSVAFFLVDEAFALRVPNGLDLAGAAPLLCAGITTYSPLRHWNVREGQKVGVVGLGGLGHMGVKLANAAVRPGEDPGQHRGALRPLPGDCGSQQRSGDRPQAGDAQGTLVEGYREVENPPFPPLP